MKVLKKNYKKWFRKRTESFFQKTALFLIAFYKCYGSPFLGGSCRFSPSCSSYAQKAFQELSLKKAFLVSLKRLLRCHPLNSFYGYDPFEKKDL